MACAQPAIAGDREAAAPRRPCRIAGVITIAEIVEQDALAPWPAIAPGEIAKIGQEAAVGGARGRPRRPAGSTRAPCDRPSSRPPDAAGVARTDRSSHRNSATAAPRPARPARTNRPVQEQKNEKSSGDDTQLSCVRHFEAPSASLKFRRAKRVFEILTRQARQKAGFALALAFSLSLSVSSGAVVEAS